MNEQPNWFFRLDDLDLLEFEYESLYRDGDQSEAVRAMEQTVWKEQEEVEAKAQKDLEDVLGDAPLCPECPIHDHDEDASVHELLTSVISGDPLTSEAYQFVRGVAAWAVKQNAEGGVYEHLFRLRANAPLVPAKLSFAAAEERLDDPSALFIAEKEVDAARIYLSRMLTSLDALSKEELLTQAESAEFLDAGERLQAKVQEKWNRLRTALRFRRL